MKTHTSSFKEQIKLMGKEIDSRITFGSTVLGKDDLNTVTPSYQGAILKSVMKQLDIDSNVEIPIGTILKYEFGLKVNGEYEYINYGNYVVYSIEKQEDTNSYKITCYDKLLYSMLDYVKLPITYPISVRDYINAISTVLGLKFANKIGTFANYNKQIQADLYDGLGYTFRDILDELAQVTASTICLNNNDELEIRYITETDDTIDEDFLKDVNVNFGEKFGKVNTIVLSRSAGSDNIYYPTVLPTNPYEIKISDNQIMNGNDRADFLPDIYNKLNGLEFYTNDFVSTGICYYDLCDRYSVKVGDTTYSCVMFNDEVLVTQGLEENIYTELPEQTKTDYKKADTTDRRINQAYAILDKQNKEFEVLVSEVNSNEEKIGSLEITTGNISTKVSSVEKNLTTTNTNLSNLSGKVDTLSNDINGVSADFEDFKDNEYINTIQNIQDQLDGAIQFWSGTEVPTLNNFPANQWNTEALRNEHQGDIYDVLQGETIVNSYKFIKIDNEYQWRLVSDSEIAAVRQLAQEALEKANKNATEIGTIKTRVSSLEQTDEQIKASVESIDKQIIPTASVSGSNIYVEDASDNPLTYLQIDGKSTQEIRNGKNKFDKDNANILDAYFSATNTSITMNVSNKTFYLKCEPNTTYAIRKIKSQQFTMGYTYELPNSGTQVYGITWDAISIDSNNYYITVTTDNNAQYLVCRFMQTAQDTLTQKEILESIQVEVGTIATSFEKYGVSPSPDYPSEIKSVGTYNEETDKYEVEVKTSGKNLFNKDNLKELNAYFTENDTTITSNDYNRILYIECEPNTTYTIQLAYGGAYGLGYTNETPAIGVQVYGITPSYTITTGDNAKYLVCRFMQTANTTISKKEILNSIQIEEGSTATEYQPYQERTSVIVLDTPLRSIPNGVKDIAYIKNNKLYVDRYVGSIVLNGSESINLDDIYSGISQFAISISNIKKETDISRCIVNSNYFKGTYFNDSWARDNVVSNVKNVNAIRIMTSKFATVGEFKKWLSTHNTQVDYELATPYTEEIGEIQMPSTFKGVNHINTTDELEPTLNIEYVRDTKLSNYVEGQINKVMTIEERHYSELVIEDDNIKASVESVNSSLNGLNTTINRVEEITTDNSQVINVISTNIDKTSGEVREVTTTTGFTFNADGMTIDDGSGFKAQHRSDGTYYKDGESVVGQYTKDGSKQKDLELFGTYSYGKESIDDTPMFVGQLYTDANGERGFGHFYNGEG